jgi:hypothetical protein
MACRQAAVRDRYQRLGHGTEIITRGPVGGVVVLGDDVVFDIHQ